MVGGALVQLGVVGSGETPLYEPVIDVGVGFHPFPHRQTHCTGLSSARVRAQRGWSDGVGRRGVVEMRCGRVGAYGEPLGAGLVREMGTRMRGHSSDTKSTCKWPNVLRVCCPTPLLPCDTEAEHLTADSVRDIKALGSTKPLKRILGSAWLLSRGVMQVHPVCVWDALETNLPVVS